MMKTAGEKKQQQQAYRIYFLRHAESANNARAEGETRNCDPGLTALGEQQQEALARALLQNNVEVRSGSGSGAVKEQSTGLFPFSRILVSPMTRTLRTASSLIRHTVEHAGGPEEPPLAPTTVEPLLCEEGGIFEGDRSLSAAERQMQFENEGGVVGGSAASTTVKRGLSKEEMVNVVFGETAPASSSWSWNPLLNHAFLAEHMWSRTGITLLTAPDAARLSVRFYRNEFDDASGTGIKTSDDADGPPGWWVGGRESPEKIRVIICLIFADHNVGVGVSSVA
ncbi:unnamed protein product [Amoebophrya sp. A120]|nr:unnamed protein product [Amoebophrya sp. A120]|eukprot:GSA120T00023810001.1